MVMGYNPERFFPHEITFQNRLKITRRELLIDLAYILFRQVIWKWWDFKYLTSSNLTASIFYNQDDFRRWFCLTKFMHSFNDNLKWYWLGLQSRCHIHWIQHCILLRKVSLHWSTRKTANLVWMFSEEQNLKCSEWWCPIYLSQVYMYVVNDDVL